MNRAQKRANKHKNTSTFIAPKLPAGEIIKRQIRDELEKHEQEIRAEAGNRGIQLVLGGMSITLKEKYSWETGDIGDLIENILSTVESIADEKMTFEEMMNLCKDYGFEVAHIDHNKIKKSAEETSKFIEEYKELRGLAKKDEVFKMFESGEMDLSFIANELNISKNTVATYQTAWNKIQKKRELENKTPEDFVEDLFEENKEEVKEEIKEEIKMEEKKPILEAAKKKPVIRKIIEVDGEFGEYKIENQVVTLNLETGNMAMGLVQLRQMIDELQLVADNMGV